MQKVLINDLPYPYAYTPSIVHITRCQLVTQSEMALLQGQRMEDGRNAHKACDSCCMANTVSFSNFAGKTILKNS